MGTDWWLQQVDSKRNRARLEAVLHETFESEVCWDYPEAWEPREDTPDNDDTDIDLDLRPYPFVQRLADVAISLLQENRSPIPVITRADVIECCEEWLCEYVKQWKLDARPWPPKAPGNASDFWRMLVDRLKDRLLDVDYFVSINSESFESERTNRQMSILLGEEGGTTIDEWNPPSFGEIQHNVVPPSDFGIQWWQLREVSGDLVCRVHSRVTSRCKEIHASGVSSATKQSVLLCDVSCCGWPAESGMDGLCDPSPPRDGRPNVEFDGTGPSSRIDIEEVIVGPRELLDRNSGNFARFHVLLTQSLRTFHISSESDPRLDAIRLAVWRIMSLNQMSTDPIAFVGYLSILESVGETLAGSRAESEGVAEFLCARFGIREEAKRSLHRLFGIRNSILHDLSCAVSISDFKAACCLAQAAVFELTVRKTKFPVDGTSGIDFGERMTRILTGGVFGIGGEL